MPPNDPSAYPSPMHPAANAGVGMDQSIAQTLSARLQALTPQEKASLASVVTPQSAPTLLKVLPELEMVMPRIAGMLPGQHNVMPTASPQPAQQASPLARTPITG